MTLAPLQVGSPLDETVLRLVLAAALGLFLGLEREWSKKSAGIRTFSLTSIAAAVLTIAAVEGGIGALPLAVGALLVVAQGVLLAVQGIREAEGDSLSLTTSASLLVAYGVGVLVALGLLIEGVTVAVVSSFLLVLKRELHGVAGALSREELRSATEFAILAFVVFPVLPAEPVSFFGVSFEPRVAWLMVVTVASIGIVNYVIVRSYGGRGVVVTGFFGGLASSTAVVGTMLDHVRSDPSAISYGVAAVLLANSAMALRNLLIAVVFSISAAGQGLLVRAAVPLAVIVVGGFVIAAVSADWSEAVEIDLTSPFSLRNVLAFGLVFLVVLVVGSLAEAEFGTAGLLVGAFVSGFVSSAGATTSAVLLYRGGAIDGGAATLAILLATAASILVKTFLAFGGPRRFARRVAVLNGVLLLVAGVAGALAVLIP